MQMPRPRVLVVDDDASIRRFAMLALEELPIELACAASVAEALDLLRDTGPVHLLITDLMMPGASGIDLLRALQQEPALRGSARLVMLTAGLDPATASQLPVLGVWRQLHKPIALAQLLECVETALQAGPAGDPGAPAAAPSDATAESAPRTLAPTQQPAPPPAPERVPHPLHPARAAALERYFGNDRGLFLAYHASCVREFGRDVPTGDAAVAARDAQGLRRLAHSLKSVLATLGYEEQAALSRQLEDASAAKDWNRAVPLWQSLSRLLDEVRMAEQQISDPRISPP